MTGKPELVDYGFGLMKEPRLKPEYCEYEDCGKIKQAMRDEQARLKERALIIMAGQDNPKRVMKYRHFIEVLKELSKNE